MGVGVVPATEPFKDISGINIDKREYIPVDSKMTISVSFYLCSHRHCQLSLGIPFEWRGLPLITGGWPCRDEVPEGADADGVEGQGQPGHSGGDLHLQVQLSRWSGIMSTSAGRGGEGGR